MSLNLGIPSRSRSGALRGGRLASPVASADLKSFSVRRLPQQPATCTMMEQAGSMIRQHKPWRNRVGLRGICDSPSQLSPGGAAISRPLLLNRFGIFIDHARRGTPLAWLALAQSPHERNLLPAMGSLLLFARSAFTLAVAIVVVHYLLYTYPHYRHLTLVTLLSCASRFLEQLSVDWIPEYPFFTKKIIHDIHARGRPARHLQRARQALRHDSSYAPSV